MATYPDIVQMAIGIGMDPVSIRPMVYKDECNDLFLLTKHAEIFPFNEDTVRIYLFPKTTAWVMHLKGLLEAYFKTDEPFHIVHAKIENLPEILRLSGRPQRRFARGSKKLRDLEKMFAHQIIKWTPEITKA